MLSNAYLLAKFRFDTAENERNFAEFLPKTDIYLTDPAQQMRTLELALDSARGEPGPSSEARLPLPTRPHSVTGCRFWSQNISTFILISPRAKIPKYHKISVKSRTVSSNLQCTNKMIPFAKISNTDVFLISTLFWQHSLEDRGFVKF